ncbi:hypothetical protein [Staphylococcus hominis]|uniref:hypothetical protein n=1 Tax=Staphylococcus hominis TaxID=1290 RepID=UPI001643EFB5|nr:hypothetical protein [Staphylococcus hominis]
MNGRKVIGGSIEIDDGGKMSEKMKSMILIGFIGVANAMGIEFRRFKIWSG